MKIVKREQTWIHTHFVTNGQRLSKRHMREIEQAIVPLLRQLKIVYGIHFEEPQEGRGIRIVLECIPFRDQLEAIEAKLKEVLKPIPVRPKPVQIVVPPEKQKDENGVASAPTTRPTDKPQR